MFVELLEAALASLNTQNPSALLLTALFVYLAAGVIKGTLGIGFPTAAVSLMAQVTDARTAITLVIMPMLFTNLWQVVRGRQFRSIVQQSWLLLVNMLVFIALFAQLASMVHVEFLAAVLGFIVAAYALQSLYGRPLLLKPEHDRKAQIAAGVTAGIMGGMVSVWAPPVLIYLSARRLPKDQFVATAGVILLLGSCVLFVSYIGNGSLSYGLLVCSLLLILPALIGFACGEQIRKHLTVRGFERLLLWFFFVMGVNLIRRAIM